MLGETPQDIQSLRIDYAAGALHEADVSANPIEQFQHWFDAAREAKMREPNAMTVATVDTTGMPSARIVLLKNCDQRGFVFFTNYQSAKGHDLANNANVALLFFWEQLERQVRVQGRAVPVTAEETAAYFAQRPRGARIGAWASPQSQPIATREVLDRNVAELEKKFAAADVPPPPHWGGYRVVPSVIEFWQGRPSRLHDRLQYRLADGVWKMQRLAP